MNAPTTIPEAIMTAAVIIALAILFGSRESNASELRDVAQALEKIGDQLRNLAEWYAIGVRERRDKK